MTTPPTDAWSIDAEVPDAEAGPRLQVPGPFGPYQLLRTLGRGGMGAVFLARDPALDREVAIKVVRPGRLSQSAQERLLREGRALAALRHPHVMRIHSVGVEGGCPYLVCERIEGAATLDAAFAERELAERVELIAEAAAGLAAAHAAGLVHRDVKPDNVVVDAEGRARVIDFGLVAGAGLERMTHTGALVGTPTHMAPEQVEGTPAGPAADVWALGVLLYQALTDELPFVGVNLVELSGQILTAVPARPSELADDVPPELEAVCLRALAKDPADRYADAGELLDALDALATPSSLTRALPWLITLVGVLVLGLGLALWWAGRGPVAPRPASPTGSPRAVALPAPTQAAPSPAPSPLDLLAIVKRDPAAARARFTRALESNPRDVQALEGRARALWTLGDPTAALADVDAGLAVRETLTLRLLRAHLQVALQNPRGALRDLDRAQELDPRRADTYVSRGILLSVLAEDERALQDFEAALQLDPDLVRAIYGRGQNLQLRGKLDEALADFDRVLELDPKHHDARVRRAWVLRNQGRLAESRAELDRVLRAQPDHAQALIERTLILVKTGAPRAALRDGNAAVRVAPRKGAAWAHRAHAKMLLKDYDGALLDYKQGLELDPKMAGAWAMIGNIRTLRKQLPEALKALTRSLELNPKQGALWFNRGRVHAMLGRFREAAQDFQAAMDQLPPTDHTWAEAKRLRGVALRRLGR